MLLFDVRVCHPHADSYRNMGTRKSASILEEYLTWNGEHSPRWFLRQRMGWGNNAIGFIVDWQSSLPQRQKSNIPQSFLW